MTMSPEVTTSPEVRAEFEGMHDEIVAYYDDCEVDYRIVWHLKNHLCMHYGYWEPETKRLREALHLMNARLSEFAEIESSDVVLDAGCGVGGSAIFLAETFGCKVHGITLSEKQVSSARTNAVARGVENLTHFDRADFCKTDFRSESFDIVWAVESVCHARNKMDFLVEAHRLLKPGGRLLVADFFQRKDAADSPDFHFMTKWAESWAIPAFAEFAEFVNDVEGLGYRTVVARDISPNVFPTIRRLYHAFVPGLICSSALHLVGRRSARQWANTWSTYYQYKAFQSGLWRYQVVTAIK